jgi:nitronate monooxygenase
VWRAGAASIIQATDLDEARRAAEVGADVIVAQGTEYGGYGAVRGRSSLPFAPIVVDLVSPIRFWPPTGRGVAALTLGAARVLSGTRFQVNVESLVDQP